MSDGKMLDDALNELREACGLPVGVSVAAMARQAAAMVREARAAREILSYRGMMWSELLPDIPQRQERYAAARAAAGE